jgi:hypothetical protein
MHDIVLRRVNGVETVEEPLGNTVGSLYSPVELAEYI